MDGVIKDTTTTQAPLLAPTDNNWSDLPEGLQSKLARDSNIDRLMDEVLDAPKAPETTKEEPKPEPSAATPEPPVVAEPAKEPEPAAPVAPEPEPALPKKGKKTLEGRKSIEAAFDRVGDHLEEPKQESPVAGEDPLDKFQVHPNASENQKSQFRELREQAKAFRTEAKEAKDKLSARDAALTSAGIDPSDLRALPQQIQALRQSQMTPEIQRELADLRAADRHYVVTRSHTYARDYGTPLNGKCNDWLNRLVPFLPEEEEIRRRSE
jgi:hypothetical protein